MFVVTVVCLLVAQGFGDRDWRKRERAFAAVKAVNVLAYDALCTLEKSDDAEVARRSRLLSSTMWKGAYFEVERILGDEHGTPWIYLNDSFYSNDARYWLNLATSPRHPNSMPEFPAYRQATRLWARYELAAGTQYSEVLRQLNVMRSAELAYRVKN